MLRNWWFMRAAVRSRSGAREADAEDIRLLHVVSRAVVSNGVVEKVADRRVWVAVDLGDG